MQAQTEYEAAIFQAEMEDGQQLIGIKFDKYELIEYDGQLVPAIFIPVEDAPGLGVSIIQAAALAGEGDEEDSAE